MVRRYRRAVRRQPRWVAAGIGSWVASAVAIFVSHLVLAWPLDRAPVVFGGYLIVGLGAIPSAQRVARGGPSRGALLYVLLLPVAFFQVVASHLLASP